MSESVDRLATLRHDLCTPINQILGYSELLEEDLIGGESLDPDDLRKIQQAARNMLELVRSRVNEALVDQRQLESLPAKAIVGAVGDDEDGGAAPRNDAHASRSGRILAVDDDELNLDLLAQRLTRQGHVVTTASDGEDALQLIARQAFDLVLLDVMMPRLDGYSTLSRLKEHEHWRAIPVIMISALDELSSVVRCIEAGAEDYLPKPFNPTLLRARIGACLDKKAYHDQELDLYNNLIQSQQQLDRELTAAHRCLAALEPEVRCNPRVQPLMQAFERMASAVSRRETDLRATIQDLEIQINRKAVSNQVKSILADPSFTELNQRARAMRARRQGLESR